MSKPTDEQLAKVVSILETYGDDVGVYRESDILACKAVAKSLVTPAVKLARKRLNEACAARVRAKLAAMRAGR